MDFMLDINIPSPAKKINYRDPLMLIGSCFTEHIGGSLAELKFDVLQNPNGILFDPFSVSCNLVSYIRHQKYTPDDLFFLNELWCSWRHHSIFSNMDKGECLRKINLAQDQAYLFLKKAKWLIITLGSSFSYRLNDEAPSFVRGMIGNEVANCHRAPAQWFNKHLMTIDEINAALDNCLHQLFRFNPAIRVIFTVSPVRHIRDGVTENNRSKARLIEVVHHLAGKFDKIYYFPAYELVIDVLRDYRFFDIDMVHPNYQATEFVLEKFEEHYIDEESLSIIQDIKKIMIARKHRAFQPDTDAHKRFLQSHSEKTKELKAKYPFLRLDEELNYFSSKS